MSRPFRSFTPWARTKHKGMMRDITHLGWKSQVSSLNNVTLSACSAVVPGRSRCRVRCYQRANHLSKKRGGNHKIKRSTSQKNDIAPMTLNSNDWKTRVPLIQYILCRGQRCRKARKYPTPKRYLQVLGLTNHGSDVLHSKKRVVGYAGPCNVFSRARLALRRRNVVAANRVTGGNRRDTREGCV